MDPSIVVVTVRHARAKHTDRCRCKAWRSAMSINKIGKLVLGTPPGGGVAVPLPSCSLYGNDRGAALLHKSFGVVCLPALGE